MKYRKAISIIVASAVLLSLSSCSSSSSRSKKTAVIEEDSSETEALEEEESEQTQKSDPMGTTVSADEDDEEAESTLRFFADYMIEEYDVEEVTTGEFYSDILNVSSVDRNMICYAEGNSVMDVFEKSYTVASQAGTLTILNPGDWMIFDIDSLTQYMRYSMNSDDGNLSMLTESVTVYDYSSSKSAKQVFVNLMKSYESYGIYVEDLSEAEYGLTEDSGHFIVGFGLEEYIHLLDLAEGIDLFPGEDLDGGGTQGQLFNDYTKAVGVYLRGDQILIVTYTATTDDKTVIKELTNELGLEDPFEVESSDELLEILME